MPDLANSGRDQLIGDWRGVGVRQRLVYLSVGGGRDPLQDFAGIFVTRLQSLEVQNRQAAETGQRSREIGIYDRVHGRGEDRDLESEAADLGRRIDVCRIERLRPGRERDVVEAVCRAKGVRFRPSARALLAGDFGGNGATEAHGRSVPPGWPSRGR